MRSVFLLRSSFHNPSRLWITALMALLSMLISGAVAAAPAQTAKISYHRQVWPILQAKCQACHQPATAGGKLIVTSFAAFRAGGEHGPSFVAGKPEKSALIDYLTGKRTLMPKGGPALPDSDIALIKTWISQGARDDTPVVVDPIDAAHPPVYSAPPVVTALAYSPDGSLLAVSGYREVLLHRADGSRPPARLVGKSQKIQSIVFSADGKLMAAVGGSPGRSGEAQFWNPLTRSLIASVDVGYDTLFGAALSPDGALLSFGGADNTVRVITIPTGKEVMRLDNHSDWVFATAFSLDGKHVLSAGRDQAIKLTLIEGASFVDDINTHTTPIRCMARHPMLDQVMMAGDDGIPRLYQIFRTTARTMNQEDHNLLRAYEKQPGVATAVAFSADGSRFAIGSEQGTLNLYAVDNGGAAAPDKPVLGGTALLRLKGADGAVFAIAFRPDGKEIAAAGLDGAVRIYSLPGGTLVRSFVPVPTRPTSAAHTAVRLRN